MSRPRFLDHVHSVSLFGTDDVACVYLGPLTLALTWSGRPEGWLGSVKLSLRIPQIARPASPEKNTLLASGRRPRLASTPPTPAGP